MVDPLLLFSFRPEEVQSLISGKLALRHAGRQVRTHDFCGGQLGGLSQIALCNTFKLVGTWLTVVTSSLTLQTDALKCVAQASKNRSLADFEKVRPSFIALIFAAMFVSLRISIVPGPFVSSLLTLFSSSPPIPPFIFLGPYGIQSRVEGRPHHQNPPGHAV